MPLPNSWFASLASLVLIASLAGCNKGPRPDTSGIRRGMDAFERKDYDTARTAFEPAAEAGNSDAQFYLGVLYAKGLGVKTDKAKAAEWLKKASAQGNPTAQYNLALIYEDQESGFFDQNEAIHLYQQAAEKGLAAAQQNLGYLYSKGIGVGQNDAEALKWYRRASEQGDPVAQYNLGVKLARGKGVPADPVQGYQWVVLSAQQGYASAVELQTELKKELSADQVNQGEALAKKFKAKPEGS